jgi:hypothetical protein
MVKGNNALAAPVLMLPMLPMPMLPMLPMLLLVALLMRKQCGGESGRGAMCKSTIHPANTATTTHTTTPQTTASTKQATPTTKAFGAVDTPLTCFPPGISHGLRWCAKQRKQQTRARLREREVRVIGREVWCHKQLVRPARVVE